VIPVDQRIETRSIEVGLKEYEVTIDGRHPLKTTMQLSDADAERMGIIGKEIKAGAAKTAAPKKPAAPKKARVPRNKAAKPAENKAAEAVESASDPGASE
jgi:hypothetical protein